MEYKDSFQTIKYRHGFIQTCTNRTTQKEEVRVAYCDVFAYVNSILAAKQWISRQMSRAGCPWTYRGFNVYPADRNSSGIRWFCRTGSGITLKSDSKQGMCTLIDESLCS